MMGTGVEGSGREIYTLILTIKLAKGQAY